MQLEGRECEINKNLVYSNSFRCCFGCVFQRLCSTLSRCVFKLFAVFAGSQQGENNKSSSVLLCNGEIAQIVVILERGVSNTPQLFKYILTQKTLD